MPLDERDLKRLWDMQNAGSEIAQMLSGVRLDEFLKSRVLQLAVERLVEIMGEAARAVSRPCRDQLPQITWSAVIATRHVLAHEYGDIDQERMGRIATVYVPEVVAAITPMLEANPPDDQPS